MKYALTDVIEDLLGVPIPERGPNAMVRCPFHGDEHASMSIDLDRGLWVCFGCDEKGGINRLSRMLDKEVNEAEVLVRSIDAALERGYEEPPDFTAMVLNLHLQARQQKPGAIVKYFLSKGIHGSVLDKFTIGWDPGYQRIAIPYFEDDIATGVKYRWADGSKGAEKGSKRYVYNVNDIRSGCEAAILCEGESDVHATYSQLLAAGLSDRIKVVGFPGVSASRSNWELYALEFMWVQKVYIAYDSDEAGDKGAEIPLQVLGEKAVRVRPKGKDMVEHFLLGGTFADLNIR